MFVVGRARHNNVQQYDRPIGEHTDIGAKIVPMASRVLALEAIVNITGSGPIRNTMCGWSPQPPRFSPEWLLESFAGPVPDLWRARI